MKTKAAVLTIILVLVASVASAEVQVVVDRQSADNGNWRECAKVMAKIITAESDDYIRPDNWQVEISADIHSDGVNIATVVRIFCRGEEACYPMVFKKVCFSDSDRAVRFGEIMGRAVRKQLDELMRVCRITKMSSLNKAAFFIAQTNTNYE